jgi:hypothetical protein
MSRAFVLSLLLLLTPLAVLGDAWASGSTQADATLIGEGTQTGSAAQGAKLWYRVGVPEGKAVHVAFSIVSGDDWTYLRVADSTGAQMAYVGSGYVGAYDPDEADAWIHIDAYRSAIEYTFTVSFINPPPQDDAGSGQDAGQRQATALAVQPGVIKGRVRETFGDVADWYRIDVPAGTIVDVHSATVSLGLYSAEGERFATVDRYDWGYYPTAHSFLAGGEPLFLLVEYGDAYSFVVDATLPADLRVDAVEVREVEVQTEAGATGVSYAREVLVTLSNAGQGPSRTASVRVVSTHEGAATSYRVVGERALGIPAGGQATIAIPWDATGQVGDVTLVATVTNQYDTDSQNDVGRVASFVLASALPTNLDLLNHEARAQGNTVRVEYGGDRVGVAAPVVGFVGFSRGVLTLP